MDDDERDEILYRIDGKIDRIDKHINRLERRIDEAERDIDTLESRTQKNTSDIKVGKGFLGIVGAAIAAAGAKVAGFFGV